MRENNFYIFVPSDLDLWPLDLKFAPLVTLVWTRVPRGTTFWHHKIVT